MNKCISGWQSGIDRRSLEIARELGITTGGYAPKRYRTEDWFAPELKDFWLKEWKDWYLSRTKKNIEESDWTLIIKPNKKHQSSWTDFTIEYCKEIWKPYVILYADANTEITKGLNKLYKCNIVNIAWPRESKITNWARCKDLITIAIKELNEKCK